ncbi:hypothetical protein SVIOM342S_06814 [Streptomyces violaceorubidus]
MQLTPHCEPPVRPHSPSTTSECPPRNRPTDTASPTPEKTVRYIQKKGWKHVGTYADEGFSGSLEADDRPDLRRLMKDRPTPRPFDMVVVNEGRGIGRTGRAFWKWVWDLEDLGVYVAVVKDYDNSTPAGRSQMRKDADYAEEERELIRERTQGGIQEKAEDGLYPGGMVPFGWDVAERGKKGASHYVVHKEEAATLRRAREVFLEKRSWEETALILNSEKRLTRSGNGWTAKTSAAASWAMRPWKAASHGEAPTLSETRTATRSTGKPS